MISTRTIVSGRHSIAVAEAQYAGLHAVDRSLAQPFERGTEEQLVISSTTLRWEDREDRGQYRLCKYWLFAKRDGLSSARPCGGTQIRTLLIDSMVRV